MNSRGCEPTVSAKRLFGSAEAARFTLETAIQTRTDTDTDEKTLCMENHHPWVSRWRGKQIRENQCPSVFDNFSP